MRALHSWASRAGAALCLVLAGCSTLPGGDQQAVIPPEAAADQRAQAMARFSQALVDERANRPEAAVSNLLEATRLDPTSEDLRYRAAMGLLQQKRNREAQVLLSDWADRHPTSDKALLWLALAYRADDDPERALAIYRRAIQAVPTSTVPYLESASLLTKSGRDREAFDILLAGANRASRSNELLTAAAELLFRLAAAERLTPEIRGRLPDLITRVQATTARDPADIPMHLALCDLYVLNQQPDLAIPMMEGLATRHPDDPRLTQKLASVFASIGDRTRALSLMEALSTRHPDNGRLLYFIGELYDQLEEPKKAREAYQRATRATRPEATAFLKLATVIVDESPEEAIALLKDGLTRLPKDSRIAEMLAYLLLAEDRPADAVPYFEKALRLQADQPDRAATPAFVLSHALALQMADRIPDAVRLLEAAMEDNPAYLQGYVQLVIRTTEATNLQSAIRVVQGLGERRAADPTPPAMLGVLHSAAEDYTNALACFQRAEQIGGREAGPDKPLNAQFHFWHGSAADQAGATDQAATQFLRSIELDPEYAEAMNYLAYMWAEKGLRLEEALKWSRKSLDLEPDNAAFLDTLGWIYFKQGDYERALKEIQKAANLMPEDPTIVEHLGDIMDKLGKPERAITYWERSFVLDPDNEQLARRLEERGRNLAPLREQATRRQAGGAKKSLLPRAGEDAEAP